MIPRPWRKTGKTIKCQACGDEKYYTKSRLASGRGKYCSQGCAYVAATGTHRSPKTEIKKGQRIGRKTEFKRTQTLGDKNVNWKGDGVGYWALHTWLNRKYGKPRVCELCGDTKHSRYEWANKNGVYDRNIKNWLRLCKLCHQRYDQVGTKGWKTRRAKQCCS